MTRIEKQILKSQKRIAISKAKERKKKERAAAKIKKVSRPRGRPRLNPELIEKARELAKTKPLADVAFKLGIALKSLRNYGVTRPALKVETILTKLCKQKPKRD